MPLLAVVLWVPNALLCQYLGVFLVSLGVTLDSAENPFAKTPFSWFLNTVRTEMITIEIPDRFKNAIVSAIFATFIPLGIPNCNCIQRVFPRNCYISRE